MHSAYNELQVTAVVQRGVRFIIQEHTKPLPLLRLCQVMDFFDVFKEGLQSVLRIGSAHNKGGPPNINIVQISHFLNSF